MFRSSRGCPRLSLARTFLHSRKPLPARYFRHFSTSDASSVSTGPSRFQRIAKPFFTSLLVIGIGLTAYGVYDYMTQWPAEVRSDLRGAMRAQHKQDYELSEELFRRAWNTSREMPLDKFPQRYLMITGIASSLGEVLELRNELGQAYDVYLEALNLLRAATDGGTELTGPERHRSVQLAYKLGTMTKQCGKTPEEEEAWLSFAVEEVLKLVFEAQANGNMQNGSKPVSLGELSIPPWISKRDIGAPLEALATFYKEKGKFDYALPLYLQLVSLLIPARGSSVSDRCQGAEFMGYLAETILLKSTSEEGLHQAEAWARSGLEILLEAQKSDQKDPRCDEALVIAFINLATVKEMSNDLDFSRKLYERALKYSSKVDESFRGVVNDRIKTSLNRLDHSEQKAKG